MTNLLQFFASFLIGILIVEPFSFENGPVFSQMQDFLIEKSSPIPANELIKYDNWEMILALSAAESTYGQNLAGTFNAWGIKDFRFLSKNFGGTRNFESWEKSIEYTSNLLYEYDPVDGMPEAKAMVRRWKFVLPYEHWIDNVEYSLLDIRQKIMAKPNDLYLLLPIG